MKTEKQIYVANCIENGERFYCLFKTNETNKDKLYVIGILEASSWGAECIDVVKIENTDIPFPEDGVWDTDKTDEENFELMGDIEL